MKSKKPTDALRRRYQRLAERLGKIGWMLQGTITERIDTRVVRKVEGSKKTYARYYQWTFKRQGKTVTVNLTAPQAKTYQRAIDNQRKADKLLQEMRAISLEFLDATTVSPIRRNTAP